VNLWPFRRQPKKPQYTINLHESVQHNATIAAAWVTYAGSKALLRRGDADPPPDDTSPFGEECYARDGMAEFWAAQSPEKRKIDEYLQLLADVRAAGFIREYVWRFLRDPSWPQPDGLKLDEFAAWWTARGLTDHRASTLAFVTPG